MEQFFQQIFSRLTAIQKDLDAVKQEVASKVFDDKANVEGILAHPMAKNFGKYVDLDL